MIGYRRVDEVGVVVLDRLPAVALGHALRSRIREVLTEALGDRSRALMVLCRRDKGFGAADIVLSDSGAEPPPLTDTLSRLEAADKPVIAVLDGPVLGLALEIALACHYRSSMPAACFGFPELRLGLLPSAGGILRATQWLGAQTSLGLFADPPMDAATALRSGLVDRLLEAGNAEVQALACFDEMVAASIERRQNQWPDARPAVAETFFADQRRQFAKRYRGQIAPQKLVDSVQAAIEQPAAHAQALEQTLELQCRASAQSQALTHLFLAEAGAGRIGDLPPGTHARAIDTVAVIGGGTMGIGIAIACLDAALQVSVVEVDDAALQRALNAIRSQYRQKVERRRLAQAQMEQCLARLAGVTDYAALADMDLVIEAVFEDLDIKRAVFARLDQVCKAGALLATNTSYQDVDLIAAATRRPGDVVGLHFFSPANVMKLLEVVRGTASAPDALLSAVQFARRLGKIPVLARVCYGFIGNRMLRQYNREVQLCLIEGATPAQIDGAMEAWGMAMGPLAVADLAGLDIGYRARQALAPALRGDPRSYGIADALAEMGRLGRKTGAGYYRYEPGSTDRQIDPAVMEVIQAQSAAHGIARRAFSDEEIVERLVLALVNEGAQLLGEGIAERSGDIDVVYCNGYGFPAFRGGPMGYADQLGLDRVHADLIRLREYHAAAHWTPAPLIASLAAKGHRFAQWN